MDGDDPDGSGREVHALTRDGDQYILTTPPTTMHAVQDALGAKGLEAVEAAIAMVPKTIVQVEGKDAEQLIRLMDALEDDDDVSNVFSNFDIDADTLAAVEG